MMIGKPECKISDLWRKCERFALSETAFQAEAVSKPRQPLFHVLLFIFYGSHGIRQIDNNIISGWRFIPIMAISFIQN